MGKGKISIQELEKTEIVYGVDNILVQVFERWNSTRFTIDSYIDNLHPRMLLTTEPIKQQVLQLIHRGIKGRTITEITEENISYVKELIRISGDDNAYRHLDNVTGNFSISDRKIYQAQIMGDLSVPFSFTNNDFDKNDISIGQSIQNKYHLSTSSSTTEKSKSNKTIKTAEPQSIMKDHQSIC